MKNKQPARILIVDDEPELRELLADALNDEQMICATAGSGGEALQLARSSRPDVVITDLCLGDCSGIDVIDQLRGICGEVPTVVITGRGDPATLSEASRRRPLELMTKPLNLQRLRDTVAQALRQAADLQRDRQQTDDLRQLIRTQQDHHQSVEADLSDSCRDMTEAYRHLSQQLRIHEDLIRYQLDLLGGKNDDDVFRVFFRTFVRQGGPVSGVALVCDAQADLRIIGRFGVPRPDSLEFCRQLSNPMIDLLLAHPQVQVVDAGEESGLFDEGIQKYLPGITLMAIPLIPAPGEMIGMVVLYRKGEQPFEPGEEDLAQRLALPTSVAVRRND
jgi:DNA-binding response OmpR family regulator